MQKLILTDVQEQILLGSLLGDGCIYLRKDGNCDYTETHCIKQKDYLLWKNSILNFNFRQYKVKSEGYGMLDCVFISKTNQIFKYYRDLFYCEYRKRVNSNILDKIELSGLAVWFMDDGWYNYSQRSVGISTRSFTLDENKLIVHILKSKFDINFYIQKVDNNQYDIRMHKVDSDNFIRIIKPYIIKEMDYKLGLNRYFMEKYLSRKSKYRHKYYINIEKPKRKGLIINSLL